MEAIYTVSQVNSYVKSLFQSDICLSRLTVSGEVSNCKYHPSGHIYFTLKDESGQISCVMFAGYAAGLCFRLSEGQSVLVYGNVDVYERDGRYQLYARAIKQEGAGQLHERYEKLKARLYDEGLFDLTRKKKLPEYIKRLGIVTASSGAALQDILQISKRRNPFIQIVLCPVKVQGDGAADEIADGIMRLDNYGVDVMIVGRGGGSLEDLWAFNEEAVVRAIYNCHTPVISAVGHETDVSLADFAADLRAPTPSAAAELAVYEAAALSARLVDRHYELHQAFERRLRFMYAEILRRRQALNYMKPSNQLMRKHQELADREEELRGLFQAALIRNKHRLAMIEERLKSLSPGNRIGRGYAYITDDVGKGILSVKQLLKGGRLHLYLTDGEAAATVDEITVKEEGEDEG